MKAGAACVALHAAVGGSSVVSNVIPRRDAATGQILDIHDGNTMRINDTFFWYGAGYGDCTEMSSGCASIQVGACGFNVNHTVNLAVSTDLVNWTLMGAVLPPANRPPGILFSPWVARSADTGLYVMWFNILPVVNGAGNFDAAYYAVATSATPFGPFTLANPNVTGVAYTRLPDAASVFVDDDGSAFLAFTHEDTHINHVQALQRDLLAPLPGGGVSAQIGAPNNEGIFMFRAADTYFVGFGPCCCFCAAGSDVHMYTAAAPLGPYKDAGLVITAGQWGAQTGAVWSTGAALVLFGDRWQSAPDRVKAHDFSYFAPLTLVAGGGAGNASIAPLPGWQDNVTIAY